MHHIEILDTRNKPIEYLIKCPRCKKERWILKSNYNKAGYTGICIVCHRYNMKNANRLYFHNYRERP